MCDSMIAVAHHASRKPSRLKSRLVRTFLIHLRLKYMAIGANILHRVHAGRSRPMISMTSGTGGSAQISANRHGLVVHASAVLCKLIRGNAVWFHIGGVGMAACAGLRDVKGVDFGARVTGGTQVVHSVTINANSHFRIAFGKQFPMHAGLVLAELIGPQPRIVLSHEVPIGMAASTERRNLAALNLSPKSRCFAHGVHVGLCRIASVAA